MRDNMMRFVGENTARLHREHLNNIKLRYSILEKSEPRLGGLTVGAIKTCRRVDSAIKSDAIALLSDISAHELYFSSYGMPGGRCERLRKTYGSESAFLYSVLKGALDFGEGYCFIADCGKAIRSINVKSAREIYLEPKIVPKLCIDLYEHAYFGDYGFNREGYLSAALYSLDLSKLL